MSKIIKHLLGDKIVLILPENDKTTPLFCHICKFPMKTLEDSISFKKMGCCNLCELRWSTTKYGKLEEGWVPGSDTEGWEDYMSTRNIYFKRLINLK